MEFGIFNSLYVPQRLRDDWGPGAEHRRFMDEVNWTLAADTAGFKYTWATEHHFLTEYSHLSANESFLGYLAGRTDRIHIGSGIFNITPPVNHPLRIAERVAVLDHLSEGRFELGMGRGSSTTEQTRLRHRRSGADPRDVRRGGARAAEDVARRVVQLRRSVLLDRHRATCSRSRSPIRIRRCGSPPASRAPSRRRPSWDSACCASRIGSPETLKPLIEIYKTDIQNCQNPVGEYINDNIMVTRQMLCLEDGHRARVDRARTSTSGLPEQLGVPVPRHVPEARRPARVARA